MIQRLIELYNHGGMKEVKRGIRDYVIAESSIPIHRLLNTREIEVTGVNSRIYIKNNYQILRAKAHTERDILQDYRDRIEYDSNPVVWDIGANVGVYSLIAAELGAYVYAFEPGEKAREQLRDNLKLNSLTGNCSVLEYALSDTTGTARLSNENRSGTRSVGEHGDEIELRTGDSLQEPTPDIVKIDVEGHELKVLDGMQETLPEVDTVYVEVHDNHGIKKIDVYRRLWDVGFTVTNEWNVRDRTSHFRFDNENTE